MMGLNRPGRPKENHLAGRSFYLRKSDILKLRTQGREKLVGHEESQERARISGWQQIRGADHRKTLEEGRSDDYERGTYQ